MTLEKPETLLYKGKIVELHVGQLSLPNGVNIEIEKVVHPGGAAIVAIDEEQNVCLLYQYRCIFDEWLWELPAGKIDNNEAPSKTASRELAEEASVTAKQWDELGHVISSPGVFTEKVYLYLARNLRENPSQKDEEEVFEVHWLPFEKALNWALSGKITDAKSIAGLVKANQLLGKS